MDALSFTNALAVPVQLFDSFDASADGDDPSYYAELTPIASLQAGEQAPVQPVHGPLCVVIAFGADGRPVGRYCANPHKRAFTVTPADAASVQHAGKFLDLKLADPSNALVTQFDALMKQGDDDGIDALFAASRDYPDVTFSSYMLALTDRATNPPPPNAPPPPVQDRSYSLATLCGALGGTWPPELPDIAVKRFKCSAARDALSLSGTIDVRAVRFGSDAILEHVLSMMPVSEVEASLYCSTAIGLGILGTRLQFVANDILIPTGSGKSVTLKRPTISLDINPLFRFVVFKASVSIPFALFGKSFIADADIVVDNVEAEVDVGVRGDASSLPAPSPIKGVRFDAFRVGMGIIFEPPAFALGLEGQFHIGARDGSLLRTGDSFTLVCELVEEVPNPLYIAFSVPQMDLPTLVETFTDRSLSLDVPLLFKDLSFQWAENPMEPVVLPDGTLSQMAFGCTAFMDLFGQRFYGSIDLSIDGIETTLATDPIRFGPILAITGQGGGVALKVDERGDPLNNAQLPKTAAVRKAIDAAPTRQFIAPGGPEARISTSSSPYVSLSADVQILDVPKQSVSASVGRQGMTFELECGAILLGKMGCTLADFHNFSAVFSYGFYGATNVSLPVLSGFSLGKIPRIWDIGVSISVLTSLSDVTLSVSADFSFEGERCSVGPYRENVDIGSLSGLLNGVTTEIGKEADRLFSSIAGDATRWASAVRTGAVQGVDDVAAGLKQAYGRDVSGASQVMKDAGYAGDAAISDVRAAYGATADEMVGALRVWYGDGADGIASGLRTLGYSADDAAHALQGIVGGSPDALKSALERAQYPADQIKGAFDQIGGDFARLVDPVQQVVSTVESTGDKVVDTIKHWNPFG